MGLTAIARFDVPVVPDAPEARDWLLEELSKPEYAAARPSLFDILSQRFFEWLLRLFQPGESVPLDWLPVAIVGLVVKIRDNFPFERFHSNRRRNNMSSHGCGP